MFVNSCKVETQKPHDIRLGLAISAAPSHWKDAEIPFIHTSEALMTMINSKFGTRMTSDDKRALGVRVLKAELEFNRKAGFTKADDRLARFFYEEPLPPHDTVVVVSDEEMDRTFDF